MTQLTIPFDFPDQRQRVRSRLAQSILAFLRSRLDADGLFHAADLHQWVAREAQAAPGSADRILWLLRADGLVRYAVINRAASLYRIEEVRQ